MHGNTMRELNSAVLFLNKLKQMPKTNAYAKGRYGSIKCRGMWIFGISKSFSMSAIQFDSHFYHFNYSKLAITEKIYAMSHDK